MSLSESAIRRRLAKAEMRLAKTPARHWSRAAHGEGYIVTDERNMAVLGASQRPYDASLDDVREFVARL